MLRNHIKPPEGTEEERLVEAAKKAGAWWERARVTVLGISILVTLLTTSFFAGGTLTSISERVDSTSVAVSAILVKVSNHDTSIAEVSERLAKLETAKDQQAENLRMFWARDWADLKRVERIEQFVLGKSTMRERGER